jgi:signal transduction histidine kinase
VEKLADACHIEIVNEDRAVKSIFFERDADNKPKSFEKRETPLLVNEPKIQKTISAKFAEQLKIGKEKYTAMVMAPLQIRGKSCGSVVLFSKSSFDRDDLALTTDIAARISTAFDNAMLFNRAQKAISLRDEFLSIASHELKTPLTPMKLQVQNLQRQLQTKPETVLNPERLSKTLVTFGRQIDRLAKLIEGLLDISRINIGKLSLNYEEFDLRSMLDEIVGRFQEQLANAGSDICIESPKQVPVVLDSFRIEQVIVNLLTNAIKFAAGKPIKISVAESQDRLVLKVADQGMGIAAEDLERIFKRFERAASATHFGGLGLGLYISQQIIEAHRGKISVESKPGDGATFIIEIPTNIERKQLPADQHVPNHTTPVVDQVVNA